MMPGIFADPDATFPIKVYFKEIFDENGNEIDVEIWKDKEEEPCGDGWKSFTAHFGQVDEDSFSTIIEDATIINHVTGKPILRTKPLREKVIARYMKSWDVGDDGNGGHSDDESVPISMKAVMMSKFKVINRLFSEFMNKSGLVEVVKSSLKEDEKNIPSPFNESFLGQAAMRNIPPMGNYPQSPSFSQPIPPTESSEMPKAPS